MIFNPASGRGRGGARIRRYLDLLAGAVGDFDHAATSRAGEEFELAAQAARDGYDTVVAVGGDGTWSKVADGLLSGGNGSVPALGVLPSGTGNDFGRNLGLDYGNPADAVGSMVAGRRRRVDVGRVVTPSRPDDRPEESFRARHFLNLVGFGFDIAVIDAAAGARFLRGEVLYKVTAVQQLFRFPGARLSVTDARGEERAGDHLMLTVSNGCFFGGGFPIAPGASVDDGRLHACHVGDATPLARARLFSAAGKGRHVHLEGVEIRHSTGFRVTAEGPPRFEIDGDVYLSEGNVVEVEVIPGGLEVWS